MRLHKGDINILSAEGEGTNVILAFQKNRHPESN